MSSSKRTFVAIAAAVASIVGHVAPAAAARNLLTVAQVAAVVSAAVYSDDKTFGIDNMIPVDSFGGFTVSPKVLLDIGITKYAIVNSNAPRVIVFVEELDESSLCYIGVTGTYTKQDIATDATSYQNMNEPDQKRLLGFNDPMIGIHLGFRGYASTMADSSALRDALATSECAGKRRIYTGHSMGGAVATLMAIKAYFDGYPKEKLSVYGFNSPPAFNEESFAAKASAELVQTFKDTVTVYTKPGDMVTYATAPTWLQLGSTSKFAQTMKHLVVEPMSKVTRYQVWNPITCATNDPDPNKPDWPSDYSAQVLYDKAYRSVTPGTFFNSGAIVRCLSGPKFDMSNYLPASGYMTEAMFQKRLAMLLLAKTQHTLSYDVARILEYAHKPKTDTLNPDDRLHDGDTLWSAGGDWSMTLRNGYLERRNNHTLDQTSVQMLNLNGTGTCPRYSKGYLAYQKSDGNLVFYGGDGNSCWATMTVGQAGGKVVLDDAGNLIVYGPANGSGQRTALWDSFGNTRKVSLRFDWSGAASSSTRGSPFPK